MKWVFLTRAISSPIALSAHSLSLLLSPNFCLRSFQLCLYGFDRGPTADWIESATGWVLCHVVTSLNEELFFFFFIILLLIVSLLPPSSASLSWRCSCDFLFDRLAPFFCSPLQPEFSAQGDLRQENRRFGGYSSYLFVAANDSSSGQIVKARQKALMTSGKRNLSVICS